MEHNLADISEAYQQIADLPMDQLAFQRRVLGSGQLHEGDRSSNDSKARADPMKYARNVMMNINTQDYRKSKSVLKDRGSPTSFEAKSHHILPNYPRSPFASNGMEIAGVQSVID